MKFAPKPGTRVRFIGDRHIAPCCGVVTDVYPEEIWLERGDDDEPVPSGRFKPQSQWRVGVAVDGGVVPNGPAVLERAPRSRFAARVQDLEPLPADRHDKAAP